MILLYYIILYAILYHMLLLIVCHIILSYTMLGLLRPGQRPQGATARTQLRGPRAAAPAAHAGQPLPPPQRPPREGGLAAADEQPRSKQDHAPALPVQRGRARSPLPAPGAHPQAGDALEGHFRLGRPTNVESLDAQFNEV